VEEVPPKEPYEIQEDMAQEPPVSETFEAIEVGRRRARKLLCKYKEHPTLTLARRVAKLIFSTNISFLYYQVVVGCRSGKRGQETVPSKWFPFPIPGLF
jgi:DNA-binding XRE family transcriptional regulator